MDQAFPKFLYEVQQKLQDSIKDTSLSWQSCLSDRFNFHERKDISGALTRKEQEVPKYREVNLEKQLQLWRENPLWGDKPPEVDVSVPEGTLCNLSVKFNVGLPPDAVYNIVTDPDNKRVFKNIKEVITRKVLIDEGMRQVVELEQAAIWRFLWWSGTISVHVLVDQNREDHTMKFRQVKTGFMKKFEGCWRVEPILVDEELCFPFKPKTLSEYYSCTKGKGRIGSTVSLQQLLQPAIVPPPPISWYVRGITTRTTEMLIKDLIAECVRLKGASNGKESETQTGRQSHWRKRNCVKVDELGDVKERWALRRRNAKQFRTKLFVQ